MNDTNEQKNHLAYNLATLRKQQRLTLEQVAERGQIVIPKKARELLGYKPGDMLVVLGDTTPGASGLALMASDVFLSAAQWAIDTLGGKGERS